MLWVAGITTHVVFVPKVIDKGTEDPQLRMNV